MNALQSIRITRIARNVVLTAAVASALGLAAAPWAWLAGCDWAPVDAIGRFVFSVEPRVADEIIACHGIYRCAAANR